MDSLVLAGPGKEPVRAFLDGADAVFQRGDGRKPRGLAGRALLTELAVARHEEQVLFGNFKLPQSEYVAYIKYFDVSLKGIGGIMEDTYEKANEEFNSRGQKPQFVRFRGIRTAARTVL